MKVNRYHDFSVIRRDDGHLELVDPPPVGALSAFALELLTEAEAERWIGVDDEGRLLVLGLVFRPLRFDAGLIQFGRPQMIVCERVA